MREKSEIKRDIILAKCPQDVIVIIIDRINKHSIKNEKMATVALVAYNLTTTSLVFRLTFGLGNLTRLVLTWSTRPPAPWAPGGLPAPPSSGIL